MRRPLRSTLFPYTTLFRSMGWITFLSNATSQKIELHTASEGGGGTELPVISIGVTDLAATERAVREAGADRKSTRLNSSHSSISYAVFCLKKQKVIHRRTG